MCWWPFNCAIGHEIQLVLATDFTPPEVLRFRAAVSHFVVLIRWTVNRFDVIFFPNFVERRNNKFNSFILTWPETTAIDLFVFFNLIWRKISQNYLKIYREDKLQICNRWFCFNWTPPAEKKTPVGALIFFWEPTRKPPLPDGWRNKMNGMFSYTSDRLDQISISNWKANFK